jgi:hypothetical protein
MLLHSSQQIRRIEKKHRQALEIGMYIDLPKEWKQAALSFMMLWVQK